MPSRFHPPPHEEDQSLITKRSTTFRSEAAIARTPYVLGPATDRALRGIYSVRKVML